MSGSTGLPSPDPSVPPSSAPSRPEFTFLLMSVPPSTVLNTEQMAEIGFHDPKERPYRRNQVSATFFRATTATRQTTSAVAGPSRQLHVDEAT
ncbi:uncharacterized protein LOC62_03G004566 [Vanrija pseudolonga]|uniref:Uncharacterized protein n=1 Tax=Vanrija pseudolonga TaxID=143232 RepID=A0AAF0YCH9_9TREE|nr:hypothetical protein LOC62_03G004566 [Vanrija pseudolonga]